MRRAKEVSGQTQRLPELFDNDTEHRSELDIFQIGKYHQHDHHLTLSDEVIKHQCNKTFLENANKVSRGVGRVRQAHQDHHP